MKPFIHSSFLYVYMFQLLIFYNCSCKRTNSPRREQYGRSYMLRHCRVRLFATPWTTARQAPLFMGFSSQGYWSGLPFPPPGDLPDPGIEHTHLPSPTLEYRFFTTNTQTFRVNDFISRSARLEKHWEP